MKKLIPLLVLLCLLGAWPALAQTDITMLAPSVEVPEGVELALVRALSYKAPSPARIYAITYVQDFGDGHLVSIAGFADESIEADGTWYYGRAVWTGTYAVMPTEVGLAATPMDFGGSQVHMFTDEPFEATAEIPILPWAKDKQAMYGVNAVHTDNLYYDFAVDFVFTPAMGTPNMAYVAGTGTVSAVCSDGTTVAAKIGNYGYLHLASDTSLYLGQSFTRMDPLAAMEVGPFDDNCGYADQGENNWHLHFEFNQDTAGYYLSIDNYRLWLESEVFNVNQTNPVQVINPEEMILATWIVPGSGTPPPPTPPPTETDNANNFWGWILSGIWSVVGAVLPALTDYQSRGIGESLVTNAQVYIQVAYVIALTNFNMTIPMILFTVVAALESVRIVMSGWMWVKRSIPFVG